MYGCPEWLDKSGDWKDKTYEMLQSCVTHKINLRNNKPR